MKEKISIFIILIIIISCLTGCSSLAIRGAVPESFLEAAAQSKEPRQQDFDTISEELRLQDSDTISEEPQLRNSDTISEEPQLQDSDTISAEPQLQDSDTISEEPQLQDSNTISEEPQLPDSDTISEELLLQDSDTISEEPRLQDSDTLPEQADKQAEALAAYGDFVAGYAKQWENPDKEGAPGFALIYLDDDDIPELAISDGVVKAAYGVNIYTYEQDKIVYIGEYGYYGCMYYQEKGGIVYDDYAQGVNACCSVHHIDGTSDTLLQSFSKRLEYSDGTEEFSYAYMIDDRNVSEEQYEEACLQWRDVGRKVIDNGMYTPMTDANIREVLAGYPGD